ncbi:MAG: hypothetical protein ACOH5I_25510 [Oligoflexus sp.]
MILFATSADKAMIALLFASTAISITPRVKKISENHEHMGSVRVLAGKNQFSLDKLDMRFTWLSKRKLKSFKVLNWIYNMTSYFHTKREISSHEKKSPPKAYTFPTIESSAISTKNKDIMKREEVGSEFKFTFEVKTEDFMPNSKENDILQGSRS